MTEVTLLGLGVMGSALARALLAGGHSLTVWNRSAAKAEPLVSDGARLASEVAGAVRASPVILICLTDYAATEAALQGVELGGKTVVQLSTGSPRDASEAAARALQRGADYLDGAIFAVPSQIAKPEATIFVSGSSSAFARSERLLRALAGTLTYVGPRPGAAAAFDLAILSCLFGALHGLYHGAEVVRSEDIGVDALGALLAAFAPALGEMLKHDADSIHRDDFENPQASLEICWRSMALLAQHAREAGLDGEFPAFVAGAFERGLQAGYGQQSPAAMVKVLRAGGRRR